LGRELKNLYITEKPSVAAEFAKALNITGKRQDGFIESEDAIITWCVGHLITMSYPEAYDASLKKWSMNSLPFLPSEFLYEVIPAVKKQFRIVKELLNRKDVGTIYVCTDSGREGEYIYRLVDKAAKVPGTKLKKRVWIDSQTEEEILRGIREAKPLSAYDNLADAAYLRAKEDYLMGINFSRALTLKYGSKVQDALGSPKWSAIAVGRVMTCVLGMVVRREREIRNFVKTPYYRVPAGFTTEGMPFTGEFRAVRGSAYYNSPLLYKENGFSEIAPALKLIRELAGERPEYAGDGSWKAAPSGTDKDELTALVDKLESKTESRNAPLLYNLAELQNDCARIFKISPDETLNIAQELYEKKLVTYPRTDARVLSTSVAKEIAKNIGGLKANPALGGFAAEIMEKQAYRHLSNTRYVNDSQITDHYAIIPTGHGTDQPGSLSDTAKKVYELIARRFLSIFYPPAKYRKAALTLKIGQESFFATFKHLEEEGYLKVAGNAYKEKQEGSDKAPDSRTDNDMAESVIADSRLIQAILRLQKGMRLPVNEINIKEGETKPPKRYTSGTLILAMENAGQLIEDEELRAQIKGSGIGTSATRAEILKKLVKISYLSLNKKTQVITPSFMGELIYEVVNASIKSLLNAELTASWEKGLTYVAEGNITKEEYMEKLEGFVRRMVEGVKALDNSETLSLSFGRVAAQYRKKVF
jgi:DNA topoisomerase-3